MANLSVGLEIGTHSVKAVELVRKRGAYRLRKLAQVKIPPAEEKGSVEADIIEAIKTLILKHKIDKRWIISGVGEGSAIVRRIKVPLMTPRELRGAIRWEAEEYIPYPIDQVALRFHILEEEPSEREEGKMSIILVGVKNEVIADHLQILRKVDISPQIIDINPLALFNIFELCTSNEIDEVALVELGHSITNLVLLDKHGPFLIRSVGIGGSQLTQAISRGLGIDYTAAERVKEEYGMLTPSEAGLKLVEGESKSASLIRQIDGIIRKSMEDLIGEIARSFEYYTSQTEGERIRQIILAGGTSCLKNMDVFLSNELGIPVRILNPFEGKTIFYKPQEFSSDYLREIGPILSVGLGLALRR